MNEIEIKILNEIIDKMDDMLVKKEKKYQDTWKNCDLIDLKVKLIRQVDKLLIPYSFNRREKLRTLTHIFNYAFFLYYRYRELFLKPKLTTSKEVFPPI